MAGHEVVAEKDEKEVRKVSGVGTKSLIIAEKPSVAKDLVKVLTKKEGEDFQDEKNFFESEHYLVSFALGHLLTICEPNEIDESYKSWSLKTLPIIPKEFPLKPIESGKQQLSVLKKLVNRKDVVEIVNACDAGREGELIFTYIIEYLLGAKLKNKKISRLWLQSMTQSAIESEFDNLRDGEELSSLRSAAKSRSEADWLIGINASRGLTGYNSKLGGFFLTPCGRVQTPTLSLIVNREKIHKEFVPKKYHTLEGKFSTEGSSYLGKWFDADYKKPAKNEGTGGNEKTREDWIFDEDKLKSIIEKCQGKTVSIDEKTREGTEKPPLLFDLTTIQRESNSKFGYSAKKTLTILQSLYERHKILTYPRTDSRFLPEDYTGQVKEIFQKLQGHSFAENTQVFLKEALEKNYLTKKPQVYDDKKISDHHAIIPTGEFPKKLDDGENRIFMLVLQRLVAIFFPTAKFLKTTRISKVEGEHFKTEGKVMTEMGWKAIYGKKDDDKIIDPIPEGRKVVLEEIRTEEQFTKPPARYTEASLLSAMEGAGKMVDDELLKEAMKERGLGTPATRAAIIEKLVSDKYIVKEGRELIPTSKAFATFNLIDAMQLQTLSSPELTGDWEYKLSLMEKGEIERTAFMNEIEGSTALLVDKIKNFDEEELKFEAAFSPVDGLKFYEYITRYISEDKKYQIKKFIGGRRISEEELVQLIRERKIGPFKDFRSKRGNPFAASLTLDEENKIKFIFLNSSDVDEIDLTGAKVIGNYKFDGSEVYSTMNEFVSESFMAKKPTGFRLGKILLGVKIEEEQVVKLISGEKTDLIKGFRSSRTKRLFDAFLELDDKGSIQFSFPEKKKKGEEGKAKSNVKSKTKSTTKIKEKNKVKSKEAKPE